MDNNPAFNAAYWASKAPAVRAFETMQSEDDRIALAQSLLANYTIDREIMVWGWDPYKVMFMRKLNGTPWVQPLNQHVEYAFGPNNQGLPIYDPTSPPPGSILVSASIKDYPPFPEPATPEPISPTRSWIGSYLGAGIYASLANDPTPDGQEVNMNGVIYVMHRHFIWGGLEPKWYTKK